MTSRKLLWTIAIVLLLGMVGALVVSLDPTRVLWGRLAREQFFQDRPVSYWARALQATEPSVRTNAVKTLSDGKAEAVPLLIELLQWQKPAGGAAVQVRWSAAQVLFQIGAEARAAVPALTEALGDPEPLVRNLSIKALAKMGAEAAPAVPALAALLGSEDRLEVLHTLQELRAAAKEAVPELRAALTDADSDVRWNAAEVLARMGPCAHPALPELLWLLNDPEAKVRWHAAEALGKIGAAAKPALPGLQALLRDPENRVREEARRAIIRIDPQALPKNPNPFRKRVHHGIPSASARRLYPHRAARGYCHHRRSDRFARSGGAAGPRVGQPRRLRKQPQADGSGPA